MAAERAEKARGGAAKGKPAGAGGRRSVGGCLARLVALSGTAASVAAGAALVCGAGAAGAYKHYVVDHPGPDFDREHVRSIIAQESPVFYRDGTTRVGVFFESEHRQFVPFDELPQAYVMAIVAAEDGAFWTHPGVNAKHLVRAVRDNLVAGDMVAGGSTLTQQTAKNLFYRPDRSLRSKLVELVNALKLEAHFEKQEILEFYANQFHVTGNGRGLGIAARHFFDKDVSDLTVVESAYLAGLVKGPANYDPFFGDEARRARTLARAHERTRYVLGRMVEEPVASLAGPPSDGTRAGDAAYEERLRRARTIQVEAEKLLEAGFEIPFKHGTFRYDSSAVLDEVARRLTEPPFDRILGDAGIDDPRNAGLQVVTTLDADVQRDATYALWHHLTEVGTWLEARGPAEFVVDAPPPRSDPDLAPRAHEFRLGRVVEKPGEAGKKTVILDLGGHRCPVDRSGVVRVAVASERGRRKDSTVKAPSAAVDAWVDALPVDAVVLASVREVGKDGLLCDLEVRPTLQGAVVVLEEGRLRAMVGGNDNRNFNRANALRQLGSTWKPLVYEAALALGWSPDEPVDNTRNVFPFSTTFYAPSPDHDPKPVVSMAWAGTNSENLASIWILYHLLDRLDADEVRQLAADHDLARRPGEAEPDYQRRIQELGILPTRGRLSEASFNQAKLEVLAAMAYAPHPEDALAVHSMLYGWGFASERARRGGGDRALDNDFQSLRQRVDGCRLAYETLGDALRGLRAPAPDLVRDLSVRLDGDQVSVACGKPPEGFGPPDEAFVASLGVPPPPAEILPPRGPRFRFFPRPRPEPGPVGPALAPLADLVLDDRVHLGTFEELAAVFDRRELARALEPDADLYAPEQLYWHQDFRVLLAMRYVARLAADLGVRTEIREVLAMPLGASEITIEEATSVYAGLASGETWSFPGRAAGKAVPAPADATLLVAEIRDVDGRVLYRAEPRPTRVTNPVVAAMTADILRNVVVHGTGRRAADAVRVAGVPVPLAGKTGTTNDFKNAAFVGLVPRGTPGGWTLEGAFTVGAYVGYDDNTPMTNGRIRLAGASGALPAWIGAAEGLARAGLLGGAPGGGDGAVLTPPGTVRAPVSAETGLPDPAGEATVLVREAEAWTAPDLVLPRIVRPPRAAP